MMDGADWLDDIAQRVAEQISEVEISRSYADTLALSRGLRSVVIHLDRKQAWLRHRSPHRVQYLEIKRYVVDETTVAVVTILSHLH